MNDNNKVYFITSSSFPVGGAGTVRRLALAKGLIRHGYDVHVISMINEGGGATSMIRDIDGVKYHCAGPKSTWGGNKVKRLYHLAHSYFSCALFLFRDTQRYRNRLVTVNQYNLFLCIIMWGIAKICKAYFFTELNENPLVSRKSLSSFIIAQKKLQISLALRLYDDIYVMTYSLKKLLMEDYGLSDRIIVLHNAVDMDRFSDLSFRYKENLLLYAGSLAYQKDYLDLLLYSIAKVKFTVPDISLRICFFSGDKNLGRILELIKKLDLSESVELIPNVSNQEIPSLMVQAHLLILIRRPNSQTSYGFPTKLVEYLASGRPVIVSSVSDIPKFLKNRDSAYLLTKSSVQEIYNVIIYALKNKELSETIGKNGRKVAERNFNNFIETSKIITRHAEIKSIYRKGNV